MKFFADFETNGLFKNSHPLSIGVIVTNDDLKEIDRFQTMISIPEKTKWSEEAAAVHGYTQEQCINAPDRRMMAYALNGFIASYGSVTNKDEFIFHARNNFDWNILISWLMDYNGCLKCSNNLVPVSTIDLIKEHGLQVTENNKLDTWMKYLEHNFKHHDAMSDAEACLVLYRWIAKEKQGIL